MKCYVKWWHVDHKDCYEEISFPGRSTSWKELRSYLMRKFDAKDTELFGYTLNYENRWIDIQSEDDVIHNNDAIYVKRLPKR